jgi:hypothetical protein
MSTDTITEAATTEAPVITPTEPLTETENDTVIRTAAEAEGVAKVGSASAATAESRAWGQQAQVD